MALCGSRGPSDASCTVSGLPCCLQSARSVPWSTVSGTSGFNSFGRSNRFSTIMEQHLTVVFEGVTECMCTCPFCEGKSSLGFNDVKGLWICFKCGEKGTAKTLVEMLEGVYTEPEVELDEISAELRSLERDVQSVQKSLPEPYLRRFSQPGRVHELWRARGFDSAVCDRWELGYDFLTGRLTLPFRDPFTGALAGVFYRSTDGEGPRYQYPKGFARSSSLYGSWLLSDNGSRGVVLVEGPTDAINVSRCEESSVAEYGSSIAQGQVQLLHRLGVKAVTLFFDYDRAGLAATGKAERLASEFHVEKVTWNRDKYCWHRIVCGCRNNCDNHDLSRCIRKTRCACKREHEPDPGMLSVKETAKMLERTRTV